MRLSTHDIDHILQVIRNADPAAAVYLFGSRLDDSQRGGDLDLLVETQVLDLGGKIDILAELKMRLGDQKIDLVLTKDRLHDPDPFIGLIAREAQRL